MSKDKPWWMKPVRVLQFNIEDRYGRYVETITGKELVELAEKIHANVLVIFARDPWGRTFYRGGTVGPTHPKMKGDLVRDAIRHGRERGIRVVVMVGHTANKYLYHQHSDWAQINRNGEIILLEHVPLEAQHYEPEWPQLCINSPFIDHVKREIIEGISLDADGVFLDSFRYQPDVERACYCKWCQRRFKEDHDYDMPREADWTDSRWRELWKWRYEVVVSRIKELYETAKQAAPDKLFMYNSHPGGWAGRTNKVVEDARDYMDVIFAECSEVDHQPPGFITEMTKLTKAMSGGKPVWSSRNYFHLYRTVKATTRIAIKQGLREAIIAGGSPWLLVFSVSYRQNPEHLDAAEQVFREHEKIEEYLEDAEPVRYAGIIVSNNTRDFYGREHPQKYVDGIRGVYYALTHSHIPVEFVAERDASSLDKLGEYKVLFVENMVCMKKEIGDAIKKYVERGGGVVSTYLTGTRDENCIRMYDFAYKDVIGASFIGVLRKPWTYMYIDDIKHPLFKDIEEKMILFGDMSYEFRVRRVTPNMGYQTLLDYVHGQALGRIGLAVGNWGHEYTLGRSPPPMAKVTDNPAVIINNYGGGKSVYFTGQLGRHYWRTGLPTFMKLIRNSARYSGGTPPIIVDAPETIHVDTYRQGERIIIHLLNHTYNQLIQAMGTGTTKQPLPPYSSVESVHPPRAIIPVPDISIKLAISHGTKYRVYLPLRDKELDYVVNFKETLGQIMLKLPKLEEYEVVVVEPRK